jgi:hypothetical protein
MQPHCTGLPCLPHLRRLTAAHFSRTFLTVSPRRSNPFCSGLSNEEIDAGVQEAKRDMFSMRISFAKREVR